MSESRRFHVLGTPIPKARARSGNGHHYTPKRTVEGEKAVREAYLAALGDQPMFDAAHVCAVRMHFVFEPPKSWSKRRRETAMFGVNGPMYHTQKPDLDNLVKLVTDALNGVAYHDDSAIVNIEASKSWGVKAYTVVEVTGEYTITGD